MPRFPFRTRPAEQLILVRRHAQPMAAYITRLTLTAVFAYLLALYLTPHEFRPVLAPLTALLVVQATLFETVNSALRRVAAVTAGVLTAVALAAWVGFSWWLLGLLIAGTLLLGSLLRLGGEALEVPVSAMLIFATDTHAAAADRVIETLIGAGAGLLAGLLFAPLKVEPARDAVGDLAGEMAGLLDQMSADLAEVPDNSKVSAWLDRAAKLRGDIEKVDDSLREAEESVRLNPRTLVLPVAEVSLRTGVETLEHAALTIRVLARSVTDSSRVDNDASPIRDPETRAQLAALLHRLAQAVRAYARLLQTLPAGNEPLEANLHHQLDEAHQLQDRLAEMLRPDSENSEWPLRGELLAHVDRLRTELRVDPTASQPRIPRRTALGTRRRDPQSPDRSSLIRRVAPRVADKTRPKRRSRSASMSH
ncbi:MAG: FUSC family protein [Streptosporangiaceae bacterium]|jgi:uncharacterized membrane protein YgaE (UPF0421/DUF939 family)